jgi:uncharacterized protein GlcG (DUF336 family)
MQMRRSLIAAVALGAALLIGAQANAQGGPPPYGAPVNIEQAKKAAAAAVAEAKKNGWKMAITIVEPNGTLVYFEKMDDTQYGSIKVAMEKAVSAAQFRRPTQVFHDAIAKNNIYLLKLGDSNPVPGGFPIVVGGKVIGGMGASGATGAQDSQVVQAGLAALK